MPNGSNLVLVDSNIFVYAHDVLEPEKRTIAKQLIHDLSNSERMAITVQIVHEFCAVMLRKQQAGVVSFGSIRDLAEEMMATAAQVIPLTPAITLRALYGYERYRLSFWDALIWASAREHGILTIYSEDFHPCVIENVTIVNPFVSGV